MLPLARAHRRNSLLPLQPSLSLEDDEVTFPTHARLGQQDGQLARLMEMPLEILFEVFCHLHPLDVLRLARTTTHLRRILMCHSSRFVWQAALANVPGLPPCPEDLSEPQYVNLAFDDHCHFCLAPDVDEIFWNCRVRCCKDCFDYYFVSDYDLRRRLPMTPEDPRHKYALPYIVHPRPRPYKPGRILYYLPSVEEYLRELQRVRPSEEWSHEKKEQQMLRLRHAAQFEAWKGRRTSKRTDELGMVVLGVCLMLMIVAVVVLR